MGWRWVWGRVGCCSKIPARRASISAQEPPGIPLLANLGAAQLNQGEGVDACRRLLDLTGADALVLHLNPLQEALQPEGEPRFRGLLRQIERLCASLGAQVVVKEVGAGIAPDVAASLSYPRVAATPGGSSRK